MSRPTIIINDLDAERIDILLEQPAYAGLPIADALNAELDRAQMLLQKGGIRTPADLDYLRQFDRECIERNLSPGGSADLLILTWFLAQI